MGTKGWQVYSRPEVRARIAHITDVALSELHVDANRTLAEIGRLAFVDMKEVVESVDTKLIKVSETKDAEPIYENQQVVTIRDWDQVDGTLIKEIGVRQGNIYVKLHDRATFLRLLAQYHNLIQGGTIGKKPGEGEGNEDDPRTQFAFVQVILNQYQQAAQSDEERQAIAKVMQLVNNKEVSIEIDENSSSLKPFEKE